MVPEMNQNKPYLSRTGNGYIKVLDFIYFLNHWSDLELRFNLH